MTRNERQPMPTRDTYQKVFDSARRRVRGLWRRNGRYFANLTVEDDLGRKSSQMVPLAGTTLDEVKLDYSRLVTERADGRLRPLGLTPKLADYVASYEQALASSGKRSSTVQKEKSYLRRWVKELGHLRLNKIRPAHLSRVLNAVAAGGSGEAALSSRSVNLHLLAVRGLFKAAQQDGHTKAPLPYEGLRWRKVVVRKRPLVHGEDFDLLCQVAMEASQNGQQFCDYLRFMQYSGARRNEALGVQWADVDLEGKRLTIGATGDTKNREPRTLNIGPDLEAHLRAMAVRRQPDSKWLFPSPQRGNKDVAARTFMESLRLTRNASGCVCSRCGRHSVGTPEKCVACGSGELERRSPLLPPGLQRFGFHDCRHHFVSAAVMAGVDFMTIAAWAGHKDGGVLIGKVYGHLSDAHKEQQAAKLRFGPGATVGGVRRGRPRADQGEAAEPSTQKGTHET